MLSSLNSQPEKLLPLLTPVSLNLLMPLLKLLLLKILLLLPVPLKLLLDSKLTQLPLPLPRVLLLLPPLQVLVMLGV